MCIGYRQLNKITEADKCSLPRIDELIDKITKANFFSKLDLSQWFHQIHIAEGEEIKTAFQTKYGSFEWTFKPFGIKNAPAAFKILMDHLFNDMRDLTDVYIDDIVI